MRKLEPQKPKGRLRAWLAKRKLTVKLWLYRYALLTGLGFVGLNAVDGYLTNYAHQVAVSSGIQRSIEANPFLAPIAGHWALSFKGLLGAGAIGLIAYVKHLTPSRLTWYLVGGCAMFAVVIAWNLYAIGVFR